MLGLNVNPVFFFFGQRQRIRADGLGVQSIHTTYLFCNSNAESVLMPMGFVMMPASVIGALIDEINIRHHISSVRVSPVSWDDVRLVMGFSIIRCSAESDAYTCEIRLDFF